jgi:hypothetical protein
MFRRIRWILGVIGISVMIVCPLRADSKVKVPEPEKANLKGVIKSLATAIRQLVDEEKQEAVTVGDFSQGQSVSNTNFGPGLKNLLNQELSSQKLSVTAKANLSVQGQYDSIADDKDKNQIAMRLTVKVLDDRGERRAEFKADVRDTADIAKLTGVTTSLPAQGTKADRNQKVQEAKEKPSFSIDGAKVKGSTKSPFAVEILVGDQPRPVEVRDGRPFVDIQRNEIYTVRLTNGSDREVAATLNIDGLDVFAFSDDIDPETKRPKFSCYIIPPKSTITITGWHKTSDPQRKDNVLQFLVTEYGKGASSASKSTGETGVLTVTFAFTVDNPEDLPPGEPKTTSENETGFGPPREEKFRALKKTIGTVRDVVTIRYTR